MDYEIIRCFSVPIIKFKFNKHEKYVNWFDESISLPPMMKTKGVPWSHVTSYLRDPDNDRLMSREIKDQLTQDLQNSLITALNEVNITNKFSISSIWYNIYQKNQHVPSHNHLSTCTHKNAFWSGIYYNKNASPTRFIRSDPMVRTQEFPGWIESKIGDCFKPCFTPEVKTGDVVIFPPYLHHDVIIPPGKTRITIAFNLELT